MNNEEVNNKEVNNEEVNNEEVNNEEVNDDKMNLGTSFSNIMNPSVEDVGEIDEALEEKKSKKRNRLVNNAKFKKLY